MQLPSGCAGRQGLAGVLSSAPRRRCLSLSQCCERRRTIAYRELKALGYKSLVDFGGVSNWQGDLVKGGI